MGHADLNRHVGRSADEYRSVHGGFGYRNPEGAIAYTLFKKRDSRLVTYQSGNSSSQLDYVFVRKSNRKMVRM